MKITLLTIVTLVLFGFRQDELTIKNIPDGSIAIQLNGQLQLPKMVKAKIRAGTSIGNSSKISVSDTIGMVVCKSTDKLVFFAKIYETNQNCPFSIVKLDKEENGYGAHSYYGEFVKEPVYVQGIPYTSRPTAGVKKLYTITPNKEIPLGVYALTFTNTDGQKLLVSMDNIGSKVVLFRVN